MSLTFYQIDAFSNKLFGGNPAGVCPLESWLPDEIMQKIAAENNISETAFFVKKGDGFHLRWFTPAVEVDFCGHATLATSHVLFEHLGYEKSEIEYDTRVGKLKVKKEGGFYVMNFPTDHLKLIENPPEALLKSLNVEAKEVYFGREDYLVIVNNQEVVESLAPDFPLLKTLGLRGAIVSAEGKDVDFVSRCFFPAAGIDEDPTTGSAHTTLTPYWAKKLDKNNLVAKQISERVGFVKCNYLGERVEICGQAVTYLKGQIFV